MPLVSLLVSSRLISVIRISLPDYIKDGVPRGHSLTLTFRVHRRCLRRRRSVGSTPAETMPDSSKPLTGLFLEASNSALRARLRDGISRTSATSRVGLRSVLSGTLGLLLRFRPPVRSGRKRTGYAAPPGFFHAVGRQPHDFSPRAIADHEVMPADGAQDSDGH